MTKLSANRNPAIDRPARFNDRVNDVDCEQQTAQQWRENRKVLLVHNPNSGAADRSRLLSQLQADLTECNLVVQVETSLERLESCFRQPEFIRQVRTVISAGGDGTASAVASRIPREVPITLFPLGTENLLARWLGASADVAATVTAVKELNLVQMDAADANGKLSLIMIGVGYDAEVVHQVHSRRTGHITKWAYGFPMLISAMQYPFSALTIKAYDWTNLVPDDPTLELPRLPQPEKLASEAGYDSDPLAWSAPWLFVANLPNYAGGLSIVPYARSDDGYLCAATFQRGAAIPGLVYAASIYLRQHTRLADYRAVRAKRFVIESHLPVRFQVDGDDGGSLPLEIRVLPNRVCLVKPIVTQ